MPAGLPRSRRGWRAAALLTSVATLVAACSAGATASPPAPSPSVSGATPAPIATTAGPLPTVTPAPSPTPQPGASAAGDLSSIPAIRIPLRLPAELSAVGDTVWAQSGAALARLSIATNQVELINPPTAGHELDNILATKTAIWLADFDGRAVVRLDPTTAKLVATIPVGTAEDVIDVGGTIWVTNHHEGSVTRIDSATNTVINTISIGQGGNNGPQQLAEGAGSVWVGDSNIASVVRLDAKTGAVIASIDVPADFQPCGDILATDAAVWVTGCHESREVVRIDPKTNKVVATIPLDGYAQDVVLINGAVWAAVGGFPPSHGLERINTSTNKVDRTIDVPGFTDVYGSAIAGGALWVSNGTDAIFRFPLTELTGP